MDLQHGLAMLTGGFAWALLLFLAMTYIAAGRITKSRHIKSIGCALAGTFLVGTVYLFELGGRHFLPSWIHITINTFLGGVYIYFLYYTWHYSQKVKNGASKEEKIKFR